MNIPAFSAQASLYRSNNRYYSSGAEFGGSISDQSVIAAYIPGPRTQERCSGCTDICVGLRDVCLAGVAVTVAEACWGTLGFGCGAALAWGYLQAGGCYAQYAHCFGLCQIPTNPIWDSPCCPKVCGIHTLGIAGSGCCDHGEACVGSHNPNTRDGCCPVGQECHGNCCAPGEYCLDDGSCSTEPGYFANPPPPPPPVNNCIFGGEPCGPKCCPPGTHCCNYSVEFGPECKTSCWA
jgi:hypothetical protein